MKSFISSSSIPPSLGGPSSSPSGCFSSSGGFLRSSSVSHHRSLSSYGNMAVPSGLLHGGCASPLCDAKSQRSIHSSRSRKTSLHLGCGSNISANDLLRTGILCASMRLGLILSRISGGAGSYMNSFVTVVQRLRQTTGSRPASCQACATSSKRSAGGTPSSSKLPRLKDQVERVNGPQAKNRNYLMRWRYEGRSLSISTHIPVRFNSQKRGTATGL